MKKHFKSGFVSLIGRPNAGKSTLLNALVGQKVAIVADKPQTTRTSIQGVVTTADAQIVFVDTPGHSQGRFAAQQAPDGHGARGARRARPAAVRGGCRAPIRRRRPPRGRYGAPRSAPALLVLNKIDLVKEKARLLPLIEQYKQLHDFADYLPISAARGKGLDELRKAIVERLPEGPAYFPEDYVTDQPERFLAAELIREKVLLGHAPGSAALGGRDGGPVGGDAQAHPHLRHHPGGARRAEGASSSAPRAPC